MNNILNTIEIALFIMLPLVIFYNRSIWKVKAYIFIIPILYFCWYITYSLLHELSHMLGAWMFKKEVFDYQLIPQFWNGDFGTGFIRYDFRGDSKDLIIIAFPYLKDILLLIIGFVILKRRVIKNIAMAGLVLVILVLSSLYDIANNYLAYLFGALNDFNALKVSSNIFISNLIGVLFLLTSAYFTYKTLKLTKEYPDNKFGLQSQ